MPRYSLDGDRLVNFVRRGRSRWKDFEVERVVRKRSKQVIFLRAQGSRVKLIVYFDGRVRAYGDLEGVAYAVKRIAERVLGLDRHAGRASREANQ